MNVVYTLIFFLHTTVEDSSVFLFVFSYVTDAYSSRNGENNFGSYYRDIKTEIWRRSSCAY
jgi:hypothetical protein